MMVEWVFPDLYFTFIIIQRLVSWEGLNPCTSPFICVTLNILSTLFCWFLINWRLLVKFYIYFYRYIFCAYLRKSFKLDRIWPHPDYILFHLLLIYYSETHRIIFMALFAWFLVFTMIFRTYSGKRSWR